MKKMLFAAVAAMLAMTVQAQPPTPKPGPEHDGLKKLVGTWDMTMKGPDGKDCKGTSVYKMELGGLWLTSTVDMDMGGMKFEGKGMDSYDANKKKFVGVWLDSMGTSPLVMEGDFDKEKKTMTMSGDGPGMDGKITKHTMKSVWKDEDTYDFMMYHGDAKEPVMTIHYKRKK